jgi:hypothetical protein
MRPVIWKLALAIVIGLGAGTVGGQSVIAGMAPTPVSLPAYPIADDYGGSMPEPVTDDVDYRRVAEGCANCSDFDLGYRFAAARHLRSSAGCTDYSWSYQRGCLAYLREG